MKKNKKQKSSKQTSKSPHRKISQEKTNGKVSIFALVIAFISFFLNVFLMPDETELLFFKLNVYLFYALNLILSGLIFYSLSNKKYSKHTAKYSFLLLLIISILYSFFKISSKSSPELINLHEQLSLFVNFLIIPASAQGIISIWQNKNKLNSVINNLFSEENSKPKLFSKKELPYTSAFIIILAMSAITLFYRLDYFDLYSDEAQVSQGAAGYFYSGEFHQYNFATKKLSTNRNYNRARPHQWLMAQSYKIFGISNWSSRFPSAMFGFLLTVLGYFISRFFIRDKLSALLISFSFVFYFEFLLLERWARMYAVLMPLYLVAFYYGHRFINEKCHYFNNKIKNKFILDYLNFNYKILPIFLFLIVINYYLHINSLFLLLNIYLYTFLAYFLFKEKKYLTAIFSGVIFIIIGYLFVPNIKGISGIIEFSTKNAAIYKHFFFGYPFNSSVGIILSITAIFIQFLINKQEAKKNLSYLLLSTIIGWLVFGYLIKYSFSFRYMSFLSPMAIIIIIAVYILILKTLYNRWINFLLISALISSVLVQFSFRYNDLYIQNYASPARPSIAWKDIINNYKKGEIIYRHWGPSFYFRGIDTSAKFIELGSRKGKAFAEIYDTLKNHDSGWLTWHSFHTWRMDKKLVDYANLYFDKLHGIGVDQTNVEVFHYTKNMLIDTNEFKYERFIPAASLNLKNTYSIGFWINLNKTNTQAPVLFLNKDQNIIEFALNPDRSFAINYQNQQILIPDFPLNNWHYLTFIQNADNNTFSVYIDEKPVQTKSFTPELMPIVKFKVNKQFKGQIDNISIYEFALNEKEIRFIIKNRSTLNSEDLSFEGKALKTLYHWKKK